ncbi:MAG TPA: chromate efflux transporter [Methylotenera sp.]|nr:chromate efflux transporter [Methylotenera sp.]
MQKNSSNRLTEAPQTPSLKQAFWYWLKLGFISFGGPAGQIAIMHQDLVENKHWISEKRFLHALNYCMLLPGPEAQQLATYIGWLMHKTRGGLVAGALFVLPSLLILITLSYIYMRFGDVPAVAGVLYGVKPAVVAIVLFAAYRIGARTLTNSALWSIAIASFVAITLLKIAFPWIVLAAAVTGFLVNRFQPQLFVNRSAHKASKVSYGKAVIDDDTPTPHHAKFSYKAMAKFIAIGLSVWSAVMLLLIWYFGWDATFTQMGWFFSKAALLTFGGAYAVLPYVYQGAVVHYAWLTPVQMMDGLALGETTPGPLIMVVAFVGFVGGWSHAAFVNPFAAAVIAACIVTFFTFLPSFIFILAGAPLIESTKNNLKFTAPLTAITAAVVGVIVSLAVFFAQHLFWPTGVSFSEGLQANIDVVSMAAVLIAIVLLFKFKLSVIKLIAIFALSGLVYQLLA